MCRTNPAENFTVRPFRSMHCIPVRSHQLIAIRIVSNFVVPQILDPSFHISPSQTSTLIAICSVLLLFTVCLTSFVVWK